jgi:uncharacterized protein YutE (UPF0331/DUF86 family)
LPSENLLRRVKRFERSVERLKRLRERSLEELLSDEDALDVLENNVRIAIEALLDVARYIIASMGWERPASYREIADILERHNVIGSSEAQLLRGLAGLRNVIVHLYAEVDYEKLAGFLNVLEDVEGLMGIMLNFVREKGLDP